MEHNRTRCLKQDGIIALAMVLFSELGLHFQLDGFRISLAVVLFPFFLMTLARENDPREAGLVTAVSILLFRSAYAAAQGAALFHAVQVNVAGAVFYVVYGCIFHLLVRKRYTILYRQLWASLVACDFGSNMVEVAINTHMDLARAELRFYLALLVIAMVRAVLVVILLALYTRYRDLLTSAEHQERYQRLFLMKTGLRTELYFMQKSCGNIEGIVKNAYTLYEKLSGLDIPPETKKLALYIACDVHDVKKDYLRITQGIQAQLGENDDEEEDVMRFQDILRILRESTTRVLEHEGLSIRLDFENSADFTTRHHYLLMSVLRCLVNNSIEAINSAPAAPGGSVVRIRADKVDGDYLIQVADNGPGIEPSMLERVFQMGYSTKFDTKTGNIYRGMGLTGAKMSLEEELGGSIWVDSTPGERTTFWVRIPAAVLEETTSKED